MLSNQTLSDWFTLRCIYHASRRGSIYAWCTTTAAECESCVSAVSGDALLANFCLCDTNSPPEKKSVPIYTTHAYKNKYLICGPSRHFSLLRCNCRRGSILRRWKIRQIEWTGREMRTCPAIFLLCARVIYACTPVCVGGWKRAPGSAKPVILRREIMPTPNELSFSSQRRKKNEWFT